MAADYHYPGEELQLFEEARQWKQYLASKIRPFIRGDVLEVGAGISETTPFLVNPEVTQWLCLEPDATLFDITQDKIHRGRLPGVCTARKGTLSDLSPAEMFDTIIYIDVLEHIREDKAELERAGNHLKEGGHLVVLSPAYNTLYSPFDKAIGHYRRYTKKSLRQLTPERLHEKRMFYMESTGMFLLFLNKYLFRKKYPSRATVQLWDRLFIPVSKILDRLIFYKAGKTIIGIWQKQSK